MKRLTFISCFLFLNCFAFSQSYVDATGKSHPFKFTKKSLSPIAVNQKLKEGYNPSIYKIEIGYTLNAIVKNGQITQFTMTDSLGKKINLNNPVQVNNTAKTIIVCMHCRVVTREGEEWNICFDTPCDSDWANAQREIKTR